MERGWRSCEGKRNVVTRELHLLARLLANGRKGERAKEARSPVPVGAKNSARRVCGIMIRLTAPVLSRAVRLLSTQCVNESSLDSHVSSKMARDGSRLKTGADYPNLEAVRPARRVFLPTDVGIAPIRPLALRGQHFKRLLDVIRA